MRTTHLHCNHRHDRTSGRAYGVDTFCRSDSLREQMLSRRSGRRNRSLIGQQVRGETLQRTKQYRSQVRGFEMKAPLSYVFVGGSFAIDVASSTKIAQTFRLIGYQRHPDVTSLKHQPYAAARAPPGSGGYRSGPAFHQPSVRYDRACHCDDSHWIPFRGVLVTAEGTACRVFSTFEVGETSTESALLS